MKLGTTLDNQEMQKVRRLHMKHVKCNTDKIFVLLFFREIHFFVATYVFVNMAKHQLALSRISLKIVILTLKKRCFMFIT